ncbi:hypothetical protein HPB52_021996 [Rhipicephalus sanguineus]|uniref:Fibronectin type-III domain-containing protein n=1 Tax=Rhipicephalus sanguineus TaxID=34632 RepID=A0A9D4Q819_RHISA|nr:hypothetical protein HPB52_021996 [Rhipicephalus sanguineus]
MCGIFAWFPSFTRFLERYWLFLAEYVLHYGTELGEWNKMTLNSSKQSFFLDGLKCGTTYRLYMTASNSIGTGEPGADVIVRTNGAAPISPAIDKFVVTNGTSAALNLAAWMTAGCPVTSFAVQYRPRFHKAWILAADAISPGRRHYVIGDLAPGRQYQVRVVAQSDAGATQADFPFRTATLPDSGPEAAWAPLTGAGPVAPPMWGLVVGARHLLGLLDGLMLKGPVGAPEVADPVFLGGRRPEASV